MADRIAPPSPVIPIAQGDGTIEQTFRAWTQIITNRSLIIGSGSPESLVEALQGSMYMDTAGTAGSILYIKRDADIAGDTTQGWILV